MADSLYDKFKDILDLSILILVFGIVVILMPLGALFVFGGWENPDNRIKVIFYWLLGASLLLLIIAGKIAEMLSNKNKKIFDKVGWFSSIVHDPEKSLLYDLFKIKINGVKLFLVGFIIFSIYGMWAVTQNTFLTTLPEVLEQIIPISQIRLAVEPAGVEIFLPIFFIGIEMSIIGYFVRKNNWGKGAYWGLVFPITLITGTVSWGAYHYLRYGTQETSMVYVAFFGLTISFLILLFGSIILAWLFKDMNNLFHYLNKTFSDEKILIVTGFILFVIIILTVVYFIKTRKQKVEIGTQQRKW